MVRRRFRQPGTAARTRGGPSPGQARQPGHSGLSRGFAGGLAARVGTGSLVALMLASGLLVLALCAVFVPGFVLGAEPGTETAQTVVPDLGTLGGAMLVTLPWGDEQGEVGLAQSAEGLTRGPEAMAIAPDGRIAILDTVNSRVVLLTPDGSSAGVIPLRLAQPRFMAVDDSLIYVLDSDASRRLVRLDWRGAELGECSLPKLTDVVTGLFAAEGRACLEIAHDGVFLVDFEDTGKHGEAPERAEPPVLRTLAGRPIDRDLAKEAKITFRTAEGLKLKRFKVDKKSLSAVQTGSSKPSFSAQRQMEHLVSLDGDGKGGLILGARLLRASGSSADSPPLLLGRLPDLEGPRVSNEITQTLTLHDSTFAFLGQPYTVAPDGRVFQPVGTEVGYTILVHSLPDPAADEAVQP
jgi:hypothetical protein